MNRWLRKLQYSQQTFVNGSPFDAAAAVARVHSPEKFVVVVQGAGSFFYH
jgi:hypothetical protein